MTMRPDQAKFDQFSNVFVPIEEPMQVFAKENDLDYFRDLKRRPSRELHSRGNPILMFGVGLEVSWHHTDYHAGLLYSVEATGIVWPKRMLTTKSDERLVRRTILRQHQTISAIQEDIQLLLGEWKQLVTLWQTPALSSPDEIFEGLGWMTSASWRRRAKPKGDALVQSEKQTAE